ncbi:MAG: hypothetical protein PHV82_04960 [Victivallaceae bacterium]|nr:hypothetical protein [Victivallaceae bacterium]
MNIYVKLTKIVYILLLACFFHAEMPNCCRCSTASAAFNKLNDKTAVASLFSDIDNDIEEYDNAGESEYKKFKKNGKQKNIRLPYFLPEFSPSLCFRFGFNHKKSQSDFVPFKYHYELQSVILLL